MKYFYLFFLLLLIPFAIADDEEEPECSWFNIKGCIEETITQTTVSVLNGGIRPMSNFLILTLTVKPEIDFMKDTWLVITEILSLTYGLIIVGIGFYILINSDNPLKRSQGKELLRRTIFTMILINISFYLYNIILLIGSALSEVIFNFIDPNFFLIDITKLDTVGFQIIFGIIYIIVLAITIILMLIKYLFLVIGVVAFPLGIYAKNIPFLDSIGEFIMSFLLYNNIFSFVFGLFILTCYKLAEQPVFDELKIMLICACMISLNVLLIILIALSVLKPLTSSKIVQSTVGVAKNFI